MVRDTTISRTTKDAWRRVRALRQTAGAPGRIGLATLLTVVGAVSGPGIGAALPLAPQPPVYGAFIGMLFALIAGTCAKLFLHSRSEPTPHRSAARDVDTSSLVAFARAFAEPGSGDAVARFPAALSAMLGLERVAVYLQGDGTDLALAAAFGEPPPAEPESPDAIAETAGIYGELGAWVPLAAEGIELGRVGLASREAGTVCESERALASILCTGLALLLCNEEKGSRLAAQRQEIERLTGRLLAEVGTRAEVRRPEKFRHVVGESEALQRVLALVERIAPSGVPILITGETGTGKELIARAVHELSGRSDAPLITVNCPAIPGPLAESELFGHERGAFTDAVSARPGQFELADGGTIFLDEVGDLPLDIQAKLLRVLQQGEVRRVGGHRQHPVDVRAIAATNRDLPSLVRAGRFREDLYYRLAAVEIELPPLRERHGDAAMLATHFLEEASRTYGKRLDGFTAEALALIAGYPWPGNVRQLQNAVQRAVLLAAGEVVRSEDLKEIAAQLEGTPATFGDAMRQEKRRRFLDALSRAGGNQSAAARLLGMSRSNFARMMRTLEIAPPRREGRRPVAVLDTRQYPPLRKE